jgi:hypothetical protein
MNIRNKLTEYFLHGGLFNPELMEHKKVCQLLIECRKEISLLDNNPLKGYQNAVDITRATELQKEKD